MNEQTTKSINKTKKIFSTIAWAILLFITGSAIITSKFQGAPSVLGYHLTVIPTESMVPVIEPMSVCLQSTDTDDLKVGDIVTYARPNDDGTFTAITHRIIEITDDGLYYLKGDNNKLRDQLPVLKEQIAYKIVKIF